VEFGFFKQFNTALNPGVSFYYSDYTNCQPTFCFLDAARTIPQGDKVRELRISNIQPGTQYMAFNWQAYMFQNWWGQWYFRVQVVDRLTGNPTQCSFQIPGQWPGPQGSCSYDFPIDPNVLSNPQQMITGKAMYAQTGIQQTGFNWVPIYEAYYVESVKVGK